MEQIPTKVPAPPAEEEELKPRRGSRHPVDGRARLDAQGWYNVEAHVRNLSACGFMAECAEPVTIGSYLSLHVSGIGPVRAQVRWQIGRRMGGMFLDPISLARCEWTAVRTLAPSMPS